MTNEFLRNLIAALVVLVWATLALSTLFTQNFTALGAVTPVMMIVVGFLFGFRREDKTIKEEKQDFKNNW